ncbi:MAG: hypothetical protein NVS2B16_30540 [Chloroflexota bacterium]
MIMQQPIFDQLYWTLQRQVAMMSSVFFAKGDIVAIASLLLIGALRRPVLSWTHETPTLF